MADIVRHRKLIPRWAGEAHPVYRLESQRWARRSGLERLHRGCLLSVLSVSGLTLIVIFVLVLANNLSSRFGYYWDEMAMGFLGQAWLAISAIQLGVGAIVASLVVAQTAPLISGEVELQSWGLLRTTTLSLREIVRAKLAAALHRMRVLLISMGVLRIISLGTGLLFVAYALLREAFYYMSESDWQEFIATAWPLLVPVFLFLVYYAGQPVIQFFFNGALGMLASVYTRSRSQAIAAALVARLALWIGSLLFNAAAGFFVVYILIVNWSEPDYAPMAFFHGWPQPTPLQVSVVIGGALTIWLLAVLVWQIGFPLLALKLAERRARSLGA